MSKKGRGRLSKIDQLPVEANPHIQWAAAAIIDNKLTQDEIREEFNKRLVRIGCDPIPRTSFNRFTTRKIALTRELAETREIARTVSEALGPEAHDDATILLIQLIKQAALNVFQKGSLSSKEIMELSRALNSAMAAQKSSAENKEREEERQKKELEKAAKVATEAIIKKDPSQDGDAILKSIQQAYGIGEAA